MNRKMNYAKIVTALSFFMGFQITHAGPVVIRDNLMALGSYNNDLGKKGYLDVTTFAGVSSDGTGDSTTGIENAINEAYMHNLIVFFPAGTYQVSRQIVLKQKRDLMTDVFALVGSAVGARPVIKLINWRTTPDNFTDTNNPLPLFWFQGVEQLPTGAPTPTASPVLPSAGGNQTDAYGGTYNQLFKGIDIDLGNNPGAIGVRMKACQGSTVQDVSVYGTNFYGGFQSTVGAGAMMGNLEVTGGKYGLYLVDLDYVDVSNAPVITGLTLTNQTDSAIYTDASPGYSPITIAGFHITKANGPAFTINGHDGNHKAGGQTSLVDGVIELTNSGTAINNPDAAIYMQNVYFKNASTIVNNTKGNNKSGNGSGWARVPEYAFYDKANTCVIDGTKRTTATTSPDIDTISETIAPGDINNLMLRHVWDDTTFPHFEGDVHTVLYPNGSNDTTQIQNAIDNANGKAVVLGRGHFKVNGTITLKSDSKLIGAGRHLTAIIPLDTWSAGTLTPVVATAVDINADTLIAFLRIDMPQDQGKKIYWLEWRAGRHSMIREVWFRKKLAAYSNPPTSHDMQRIWIHGGTAGGRIYSLFTRSGDYDSGHVNFRYLMIEGTAEPLYIYGYNPEYAYNGLKAQVEVKGSSNVTFLGFKAETMTSHTGVTDAPVSLLFDGCTNVAVIGSEGLDWVEAGEGLIEFEGWTSNYLIANKGRRGGNPNHHPSHSSGNTWYESYDRSRTSHGKITIDDPFVSVLKQGSPLLVPIEPGAGSGGAGEFAGENSIESYQHTGKYADFGAAGTELFSGASAVGWEFVSLSGNEYNIRNGSNYLEADNSGGWKVIEHQAASGGNNQIWIIEDAVGGAQGTGNHTIRSKTTYNGQDLHICYNNGNSKFFTTTGGVLWTSCAFAIAEAGDTGLDNKIVFIENAGTGDHLTFSGGASGSTATLTATPGSGNAYKWKLLLVAGTTDTYTIESQYEATVKHFCTNHTNDWGQGRVYDSIQGTNGDRGKFKIIEDGDDYTIMLVEGSRYLYDSGAQNYPRSHASPSANDLWIITITQ